jgi:hypothetical protein
VNSSLLEEMTLALFLPDAQTLSILKNIGGT